MTAALLIARSIARPVRRLGFAAAEFGTGNFSVRAPAEGQDELSQLGVSFNSMAEQLEKREARFAELSNKEIAAELNSVRTIEGHISRILDKKNLSNRVELALHVRERRQN